MAEEKNKESINDIRLNELVRRFLLIWIFLSVILFMTGILLRMNSTNTVYAIYFIYSGAISLILTPALRLIAIFFLFLKIKDTVYALLCVLLIVLMLAVAAIAVL